MMLKDGEDSIMFQSIHLCFRSGSWHGIQSKPIRKDTVNVVLVSTVKHQLKTIYNLGNEIRA